ncbi:hypothetical protein [Eisenibacter elegans]|jgi:DNA-directed RNA polymerase sigma subunit (sigma70/sigma32)|uniref:hypothetical protein n=1 Tax=Eisenibacter elegans TaxID=997 RepID=UPI00041090F3|nr:hypothetical protein [Eisenibacter elegans]
MGIEEAILQEVREQGLTQGQLQAKIQAIQKVLRRGKLTLHEIAEGFEVSLEFVRQVKSDKTPR